jgi:MFS transporter, PPP family, 3-phenylpropionic acid transporter
MDSSLHRYAVFYFCYYAALGAYTPYIGRWVDALGHSGYVVGAMLGLWYGSRVLGPPAWAHLVGNSHRPGNWFVLGSVLTAACFALFLLTESAIALLIVMAIFGLFYNAVMPQFEAMTLSALGPRSEQYGRIRLWGSVGFLIVASSYGWLLDRLGSTSFPLISLPLFLLMVLAAWPHRGDQPAHHVEELGDAGHLWRRPGVRRFLLVALLMQVGFGAFYVFYTLHLQTRGHSGAAIGMLWGLGVAIEIAMFWQVPQLIARYGAPRLISVCIALTVLRWLLTAILADSLAVMALAQLLHAFGFAVFHACCMRQMTEFFPGRRAAAGQSLLYGFSSGVGGVIGALLSAAMWDLGGGRAAFLSSAMVAALAWLIYAMRRQTPLSVAVSPPAAS